MSNDLRQFELARGLEKINICTHISKSVLNQEAEIIAEGKIGEWIQILKGRRQGCG